MEKSHWGKMNNRTAVYIVTVFNITRSFNHCEHSYIVHLKNQRKKTIFNINTHFTIRTTYFEFQTSTTIVPQENLTSDCEIKQYIWQ